MEDWETVFGSNSNSGLYSTDNVKSIRAIKKAAINNGLDYVYIDLKRVSNKESLLKAVARALHFPSYFGMNWDALNDCLKDMSWKPAAGYVVVLDNFRSVSEHLNTEVQIVRSIFESSAEYWREKKAPFYIILFE